MNKSGFATFFSGSDAKYENASEMFEKAGNAYKTAKAWGEAGGAFREASACHLKLKSASDAAGKLKEVRWLEHRRSGEAHVCLFWSV
jgi:alpha-soluble NSF attachment protein